MSNEIFGRSNVGFGGAFDSSKAVITVSGGLSGQLLLTDLSGNYTRNVQQIFELESNLTYLATGRAQGQGQVGAMFGPKASGSAAYSAMADPCNATNISFSGVGGCTNGAWGRTLHHVVLNSLGFQVQAQDMLIKEQIGFVFVYMSQS